MNAAARDPPPVPDVETVSQLINRLQQRISSLRTELVEIEAEAVARNTSAASLPPPPPSHPNAKPVAVVRTSASSRASTSAAAAAAAPRPEAGTPKPAPPTAVATPADPAPPSIPAAAAPAAPAVPKTKTTKPKAVAPLSPSLVSPLPAAAAAAAAPPPPPPPPEQSDLKELKELLGEAGYNAIKADIADIRSGRKTSFPQDLVFVSAEVAPWSKTGGLGDVMGALPAAMAARGHRVMVVTPLYRTPDNAKQYDNVKDTGVRHSVDLKQGGRHDVAFHHLHKDGVDYVFIDHISYHRPGNPYGNAFGPYTDNLFRFALLSMAACEAPLKLNIGGYSSGSPPGLPYGQDVCFIGNDWHAALVPVYLASVFKPHGVYQHAACVLALHNLAHQGSYPPSAFSQLGLPPAAYPSLDWVSPTDKIKMLNVLKGGIATADAVVSVSQAYCYEIVSGVNDMGLKLMLQQRRDAIFGIINGIDPREWDPATDKLIQAQFSRSRLAGKAVCKAALQAELGLPDSPDTPIIGFIGRLDYQKGPDLVLDSLPFFEAQGCHVVMLGSGAPDYEAAIVAAEKQYRETFRGWVGFSNALAHKILAGADILLMPSRFEPCGLNQMYAMRYGTVPVVHATGGLRDTVEDYNPFASDLDGGVGTGWTFAPATAEAMEECLAGALRVYNEDKKRWAAVQAAGMARDFSWDRAAKQYEVVFQRLRLTANPAAAAAAAGSGAATPAGAAVSTPTLVTAGAGRM